MALERKFIPKLGRDLARLGFGALPFGPLQRNLPVEEAGRIVRKAVEAGVDFIDTAQAYGTYEHIRKGLDGFRGDVAIATKTAARRDGQLAQRHVEDALRALGRDVLDVVLLHGARSVYSDAEWGPSLDALLDCKRRGLTRLVGISSHSIEGVRVAAAHPDLDAVHPLVNLTGLGITDGGAAEMAAAVKAASDAGKFVYAMKPLGGGNLVARREEALRYVFSLPGVDVVALGMVSEAEVAWNAAWASGAPLPELAGEKAKRVSILEFLCKGCGACVERCDNRALSLVNNLAVVADERCLRCGYCGPVCPQFAIRFV